jgi:Domain of unknown function (DUF1707)/2TM domain
MPSSEVTPRASEATLRASDAEREHHVELLREHAGEGRLTPEELSERLDRVYEARTRGELSAVLDDLPAIRPARDRVAGAAGDRAGFYSHLTTYLLVNLMLIGIWAATGAGYFWPVWPLLGWGIGVASHASETFLDRGAKLCGGRPRSRAPRRV